MERRRTPVTHLNHGTITRPTVDAAEAQREAAAPATRDLTDAEFAAAVGDLIDAQMDRYDDTDTTETK